MYGSPSLDQAILKNFYQGYNCLWLKYLKLYLGLCLQEGIAMLPLGPLPFGI